MSISFPINNRLVLWELVLLSPPWVILCEEPGSPVTVVGVSGAAFLPDLGKRVTDYRVAVEKDGTVAAELVETRPERSRVGVRYDPFIVLPLCIGEPVKTHAVDSDAREPLDGPFNSGDNLWRGFF